MVRELAFLRMHPSRLWASKSPQSYENKGRANLGCGRPASRVARAGCASFAGCAEMLEGKELGGGWGISWDIIPFG
jgi:hypothetical protein